MAPGLGIAGSPLIGELYQPNETTGPIGAAGEASDLMLASLNTAHEGKSIASLEEAPRSPRLDPKLTDGH